MSGEQKAKREPRYDPGALRRAIKRNKENVELYKKYIEQLEKENEYLSDCLEKELNLREKEGRANGDNIR